MEKIVRVFFQAMKQVCKFSRYPLRSVKIISEKYTHAG